MHQWQMYYAHLFNRAYGWAWVVAAFCSTLLAIALRYLQDRHPELVRIMTHWGWEIPLWLFLIVGVIRLFIVPYLLHKEEKEAADATETKSQARIRELVAEINKRPALEILFDDDYVKTYPAGANMRGVMVRLYKVAVRGKSGVTIEDVNLELVGMDPKPSNSSDLPLPLHALHEAAVNLQGVQYGGLNPETLRFFDVIQMPENGQGWMQIYTTAPVDFSVPRRRYVLKLRANGKNAIPAERSFVAEVNIEGKLLFYAADKTNAK